jgi:hypothetical protein
MDQQVVEVYLLVFFFDVNKALDTANHNYASWN